MKKKVRVNITVDSELLEDAKKKLKMFGGKVSTLFNAYLADFVKSMEKSIPDKADLHIRLKEFEERLKKLERRKSKLSV